MFLFVHNSIEFQKKGSLVNHKLYELLPRSRLKALYDREELLEC